MEKVPNQIKTLTFIVDKRQTIELNIKQVSNTKYSSVIWPSANLLCQFICDNVDLFKSKMILELGSGTGICGIMAGKIGANVILSDNGQFDLMEENLKLNHVQAKLLKIHWANREDLITNDFSMIDCIIGSDLCYEESQFEKLLLTISFLMNNSSKPNIPFYMTYHLRCSHHNIECLLKKFQLTGRLLSHCDYKIYLYEIKRKLSPS